MTHDDHDHDHDHAAPPDDAPELLEDILLEQALRTLLIDKGVLTAAMIHRQIDGMDSRNPALGAQVVARAWTDPAFRASLVATPLATIETELGLKMAMTGMPDLRVVENAPGIHNVVVCTLCSCYPRMLLGIPPAWYKAPEYRARVVREPRAILHEFGLDLPQSTAVHVHDSTADLRYLVLPERPQGTEGWTREALAAIVTRDCMIGTALPNA